MFDTVEFSIQPEHTVQYLDIFICLKHKTEMKNEIKCIALDAQIPNQVQTNGARAFVLSVFKYVLPVYLEVIFHGVV